MRRFFLILALFSSIFASNSPFLVLGPNIEYGVSGAAAPANVRGAFVPQANANFEFSWLEPLGMDYYGAWRPNKTNYMRFFAGTELSPFYGVIRVGLGFAPLPPPFSVLEIRFVYSNENLLLSDIEMPLKPNDNPSVSDTWDAGYMFDNFYSNSSHALIQSFDLQLGGRYDSPRFFISFLFHFALIDINSNHDKKSFDYARGIPVYSRDYIVAEELFAVYNFSKHFSFILEFSAMFSGRRFQFYSPFEAYDKEPLYYNIISAGPLWRFDDGKSYLSISPGFFTRGGDGKDFSDSIKERVVLSIQYKRFWDFRFGKTVNQ
ncbi:MAG: hypothetical protein FWB90_06560 [Fibromonadales bacterium]|nr:hypothetical protein [Fibromonadales bacterium]